MTNGLAAFADWSGYYRSFHNESTTQLGLAVCIKCGRNKNKANEKLGAGKRDDLANRIESIKARLGSIDTKVLDGTMKSNLLTKLDDLKNRAAIAKDKEEYLQILKELEGITKEIRNNKNIDEKIRRKENQLD